MKNTKDYFDLHDEERTGPLMEHEHTSYVVWSEYTTGFVDDQTCFEHGHLCDLIKAAVLP